MILSSPRYCCQLELPHWPVNGSTLATLGGFCRGATISLIDATVRARMSEGILPGCQFAITPRKDSADHQMAGKRSSLPRAHLGALPPPAALAGERVSKGERRVSALTSRVYAHPGLMASSRHSCAILGLFGYNHFFSCWWIRQTRYLKTVGTPSPMSTR